MAQGKIKKSDVSVKDPFGDISQSAKAADANVKSLEITLKAVNQMAKEVKKSAGGGSSSAPSSKVIKDQNALLERSNAIAKSKLNIDKKLKEEKIKFQELTRRENKEIRESIKNNLKLGDATEKLERRVNKAQREFKNLAIEQGVNSRAARRAKIRFDELDGRLRSVNNAAKDGRRDVGRYGLALNKVGGLLRNGLGAAGFTLGAAGIFTAVKGLINIFQGFQKANSNLKAVLGGTKEEMLDLSSQAKAFGRVTSFTATQVVELQTELAKLGFPTQDIIKMTRSTLDAAAAMGSSLGEQAKLTGSVLRAFRLEASQTERVNDVLAKSTSKSALDFQKLNAALSTVAPVANAMGFSIEETTALLGELSNAGFEASTAATSTRNILLNLADSNGKLAQSLGRPVNNLKDLVSGLKELDKKGIDVAASLELTDRRSVAAFQTFLKGADNVKILNDELKNAQGTAEEMANTQLDNLAGSITKLNSAWEGFILSMEDGEGFISRIFQSTIDSLTNDLIKLGDGFKSFKQVMDELFTKVLDESVKISVKRANELVEEYKVAGKSGRELRDALRSAAEEQVKLSDAAKKRGDKGLSAQYRSDALELLKLVRGMLASEKAIKKEIANTEKANTTKERKRKVEKEIQLIEKKNIDIAQLQTKKIGEQTDELKKKERVIKDLVTQESFNYDAIEKALSFTEALFEEHYDKRLELIKREGKAHEDNLKDYKQAAREGNIAAQESLAEESRLAEQAKAEENRIEKEKQAVLMVTSVLQAFNSELSSGKNAGQALVSAITSTTALQQFAKALPAFIEGTENVGKSLGNPQLSGEDGYIVRVDGRERIVDPENNYKIGNYTNDEVANIMEQYRLGNLATSSTGVPIFVNDNSTLEAKLESIEQAIINRPVSNTDIGRISQTVAEIREVKKLGNRVVTNRFVVR